MSFHADAKVFYTDAVDEPLVVDPNDDLEDMVSGGRITSTDRERASEMFRFGAPEVAFVPPSWSPDQEQPSGTELQSRGYTIVVRTTESGSSFEAGVPRKDTPQEARQEAVSWVEKWTSPSQHDPLTFVASVRIKTRSAASDPQDVRDVRVDLVDETEWFVPIPEGAPGRRSTPDFTAPGELGPTAIFPGGETTDGSSSEDGGDQEPEEGEQRDVGVTEPDPEPGVEPPPSGPLDELPDWWPLAALAAILLIAGGDS